MHERDLRVRVFAPERIPRNPGDDRHNQFDKESDNGDDRPIQDDLPADIHDKEAENESGDGVADRLHFVVVVRAVAFGRLDILVRIEIAFPQKIRVVSVHLYAITAADRPHLISRQVFAGERFREFLPVFPDILSLVFFIRNPRGGEYRRFYSLDRLFRMPGTILIYPRGILALSEPFYRFLCRFLRRGVFLSVSFLISCDRFQNPVKALRKDEDQNAVYRQRFPRNLKIGIDLREIDQRDKHKQRRRHRR